MSPSSAVEPSAPPSADPPGRRARLSPPWAAVIAAAQLAVLVATSTRYGYHRDELYFIAAGAHPAFGYPDQPALVPLLCRLMNDLAPGSLFVLHLPSAIVAGLTTLLAALIAREVGGTTRAQVIAAGCTAVSGFALAVGHFVTTTTFDLLSTSGLCWLLIVAIRRRSGPALLAAGVVAGVGFEAKPQVALVAVVALGVLAVVGPRWPLRSPWLAAAIGAALLLAAPYVGWQAAHGWPQLAVAGNIGGSAEGGRVGFLPFQLILVSPVLVPAWVAGLVAPFRRESLRALRFLPLTYLALAAIYLAADGKAYYLASLYPALLGLGAVPVAAWTLTVGRRRLRTGLLAGAIAITALISAVIALPLLPASKLQGSITMAANPDIGETVGWPAFIDAVGRAWQAVPAARHDRTVIFTANYGEAGAVDLFGRARGLPRAYSGHNGFAGWGRPGPTATSVLLIGFDGPADAAPQFDDCRTLARVDNGVGLDNQEQGLPVMLCRPTASWVALWPQLTHLN